MDRGELEGYSRRELLNMVISSQISPSEGALGLGRFPEDVGVDLASIGKTDLVALLKSFVRGERTADELRDWAEFLEVRDDVGCDSDQVLDVLFYLANPQMNGAVTAGMARDLIRDLAS